MRIFKVIVSVVVFNVSTHAVSIAQFLNYDPFNIGLADTWKHRFVSYTLRWGRPSTDERQWFYELSSSEFARLKRMSDCPEGTCPERTVFKVQNSSDVAYLRDILVRKRGETVKWAIGFAAGFSPHGRAYEVLMFLLGQSSSAKNYRAAVGNLDVLIGRGGEIVYEERLTSGSSYWLTRSILYRIRMGDEVRMVPLWVTTFPAHIR
jgi:hypothetical protein